MNALLLDVGNTRLKWGVDSGGRITTTGDIAQEKICALGLGELTRKLPRDVDAAIASNVAGPTFATRLTGVIHAHCNCDLHFAKAKKSGYGITNRYKAPRRIGVDRWVAMVGAWAELGRACIVVDAGTAVTIDALDDEGNHLGGMILPGVATMADALAANTSDIPPVRVPKKPRYRDMDMFTGTTRDAVASGALQAVAGAIERAITTLRSNAYDPVPVLTGGDASRMLSMLGDEPLHRPNLVLEGLSTILAADHPRSR
jgi:type III pantothenate kinase